MATILKLSVENFKRIRAIQIEPSGALVPVTGANTQGKTSALDAIEWALNGVAKAKFPDAVRHGATEAKAVVDLGDLTVTRTERAGEKSKLVVKAKDGRTVPAGQSVLDRLIGKLSFDPTEFARLDAKGQRQALLEVVDLPFNLDEIDAERKAVFDERTDQNRHVKELASQLSGTDFTGVPDDLVSVAELTRQYTEDSNHLAAMDRADDQIQVSQRRVEQLEQQLDNEKIELEQSLIQRAKLGQDAPDLDGTRQLIEDAEETNAKVRAKKANGEIVNQHANAALSADMLSTKLKKIDDRKANGLQGANFPLEGLSINTSGVTYQDVPLEQASGMERIKVSMAVAMALNPDLKVVRIRNGNELDSKNLQVIEELAEAQGFQVWLEYVSEDPSWGHYIEDGEVK